MWADRYTVYYSKDMQYAVRWLAHGQPEEEAEHRKFDDRVEAERFYNNMIAAQRERPTCRVELFFSQAKWVRYHANHDEVGTPVPVSIVESETCRQGGHERCPGDMPAAPCTCPCHTPIPNTHPDGNMDESVN